ncbi:MAG TPA: hypothetical protein VGA95_04330 [Thermodesulfobacteriota bacterium]
MMKITLLTIIGMMILMHLSCAGIRTSEAQQVDSLLAAAGFKMLPADTPEKEEMLNSLPPLNLQYRVKDGNPLYFYADPYNCKCVYTGDQAAYDRYEKLAQEAAEQQAAFINEEAAMEMNSWDWLGGPWGWW